MKIGLIDVDGHNFPNFALMKCSSYYKSIGASVSWANGGLFKEHYDQIISSKVFSFTDDIDYGLFEADLIRRGGTGYDISTRLSEEEDLHLGMDYSLYPQYNFSIQFFSRGCIRKCPFCLVREKEGYIKAVDPVSLNPRGEWIEVLDNNFFANPEWHSSIDFLLKEKQPVKLHGVDVRIMNEEQAFYLNKLKLKNGIHIAWDLPNIDLTEKIKNMTKYIKPYKIVCYVLVGFNSTKEQDLHRLRVLKDLGVYPFVQPYRDYANNSKPSNYEKDISRWANRAWLFKSMDFMDYSPRKGFKCSEYFK